MPSDFVEKSIKSIRATAAGQQLHSYSAAANKKRTVAKQAACFPVRLYLLHYRFFLERPSFAIRLLLRAGMF